MVQLENMPAYLQEAGRFCLWKREQRGSSTTKVPYNPKDPERRASSADPGTFCTWSELLQIWPQVQDRFSGIGVGVFGDIAAVDIDHCFKGVEAGTFKDTGVIDIDHNPPSQMAMYIVNRLQCYTEKSPSGDGIRIFFRIPPGLQYDRGRYYINNREKGLEIYLPGMTRKFLTFTGNTIRQAPVRLREAEVLEIVEKFMKRPEKAAEPARASDPEPVRLEDDEIIRKAEAATDGRKFMMLYSGDWEGAGYGSQSEADQALCNMLSFWTGRDPDQIDRLFRSSGLMRPKWERADYSKSTISKAIRDCMEVYTGPQRSSAAEDFKEDPEPESRPAPLLPEPETFTAEMLEHLPELRPAIIEGVLRAGHKMMIAGASKAGKSFSLIELALALASGGEWMGLQCRQCKVLYANLEVDGDSFKHRIAAIMKALEIGPDTIGDRLTLWNLRGKARKLSSMLEAFKEKARGCDVLILDPIYKIMEGDENSASEMGEFTRSLDRLAEEGAAIIYAHHFGKGTQAQYKDAMNRASGSGVFARDPDAILSMSTIDPDDITTRMKEDAQVSIDASAYELSFTLREFRPLSMYKIWFDYPVHVLDNGALDGIMPIGRKKSAEEKKNDKTAKCIATLSLAFDEFKDQIGKDGGISIAFLDGRVDQIGGKGKKASAKTIKNYANDSRGLFFYSSGNLYRGTNFHKPETETPFDEQNKME